MINLHIEGGVQYMVPLSILLITNLALIGYALYKRYGKQIGTDNYFQLIHHVSLLALVWGVLSTSLGLFQALGYLAKTDTTLPLNVIMGGLRVAMITAIYGMIIFLISRLALIFLKPWKKRQL